MDKLRQLTKTKAKDGIIFDDMRFTHLHREAQIHLVDTQDEGQVHARYEMIEIPAGTPKIITTNLLPSQILNWEEEAIRRRVTTWEVKWNMAHTRVKIINLNGYHNGAVASSSK